MYSNKLAHTVWDCKYHLVFVPKYRRKIIYGKLRRDIGEILRTLCEYKGIEILEAHACVDHIHMCIKIPPKYSVSSIVGYLKGKSAIMIFERHSKLRQNFKGQHFWARGYYISTVGLNEQVIRNYMKNQENKDLAEEKYVNKNQSNPF
ncbi:IS200/IS605 family transposase [Marinisporobacter balticus]|uniref:Putative transposase n=1 Tax=Marinisporobacter balticus TaxID=2018667 RepID=A0A4R2L242_9FIRM|nr:IS200/IS605 family transposase [Marinisporobacter balticus]TCO73115.1 putative transposase [Marinisporobacter balticus]